VRLLIAGSRTLSPSVADIDDALLDLARHMGAKLVAGWKPDIVISGCARGADEAGEAWARARGVEVMRMPADWRKYGRSAGPRRNAEMSLVCTASILWWDGESAGTANMIARLVAAGKPHIIRGLR
jgi:hypothetical protein